MNPNPKLDQKPRRLGRGLSSLLGAPVSVETAPPASPQPTTITDGIRPDGTQGHLLSDVISISVELIQPSPFQPRRVFDETQLAGLAQSIRQSGVLQPVLVRPRPASGGGARYELIAGERRWRAAKLAGVSNIPVLIRQIDDEHAAELALVENVQREDLNAMERAWALKGLMDRFGLTQAKLADRVGLERSSVANFLRLTELELVITDMIAGGKLSAGHGKALLAMPPGEARVRLAKRAGEEEMSVRELERLATAPAAETGGASARPGVRAGDDPRLAVLSDLQRQIGQQLGTKVFIIADRKGKKGKVVMEFYGLDHFDSLMSRLGVKMQ